MRKTQCGWGLIRETRRSRRRVVERVVKLGVFSVIVAILFQVVPVAQANSRFRVLLELFETPVFREMRATPEVQSVMRSLGVAEAKGLARALSQERLATFGREFEVQVRQVEEYLGVFRRFSTNSGRAAAEGSGLAPEAIQQLGRLSSTERHLVRILSGRYLSLRNSAETLAELAGDGVRFAGRGSGLGGQTIGTLQETRSYFRGHSSRVAPHQINPILAPATRGASTPWLRDLGLSRARGFFSGMRECLRTQTNTEESQSYFNYLLTGLGIAETVTVGGLIVGEGLENVDWSELSFDSLDAAADSAQIIVETGWDNITAKDLSTDMLMAALSAGVKIRLMKGNDVSFMRRWVRVMTLGFGQSAVDAVIYHFNPISEVGEIEGDFGDKQQLARVLDEMDAVGSFETSHRFVFNLAWNAGMSWKSLLLYDLVMGMKCMYPGSKFVQHGTTALRFADSAANSVGYFYLRSKVLERTFP